MKSKKNTDELKQKIESLKQEFKDLSIEQKELLLYRKIIELKKIEDNSKEFNSFDYDDISCLIKVASVGFLKPLVVYANNHQLGYKEIYKESLICYNNILENYKKLAQELKINSSLNLSNFLTYLLWNGYFSVNKKHSYNSHGNLSLLGMQSFDVIKGKGACLAYAELLRNYLLTCEKNSAILNCSIPTLYQDFFEKKIGNHAITLIEEKENIYAYDPTNLFVLNIKDSSTISIINGKGEFQIKPLTTFLINPNPDPNHIFEKLLFEDVKPAFSKDKIESSYKETMEQLNDNISLLDDAYDNIHSDLEFIDKQTDEIGGYCKALKRNKNKANFK